MHPSKTPLSRNTSMSTTNSNSLNCNDSDLHLNILSLNSSLYIGCSRTNDKPFWTATKVDLIFSYNSQLRALTEVYASPSNEKKFVNDFICVWNKVMNADRFDLKKR